MMKSLLGLGIAAGALLAVPSSMAACSPTDIRVVKAAVPTYPLRAMRMDVEGYVVLEFVVGTDGKAKDVRVLESDPPGVFNRAVMRAVLKSQFQPCMIDGLPVEAARGPLKYTFTQ